MRGFLPGFIVQVKSAKSCKIRTSSYKNEFNDFLNLSNILMEGFEVILKIFQLLRQKIYHLKKLILCLRRKLAVLCSKNSHFLGAPIRVHSNAHNFDLNIIFTQYLYFNIYKNCLPDLAGTWSKYGLKI